MRRLPRIQRLCALHHHTPTASSPAPLRRHLSTTRASRFLSTSSRTAADDKQQRQDVLDALERDRQAALSLQSESAAELAEFDADDSSVPEGVRIAVPPDFSYAPSPKQVAGDGYVPAKTAEGLERVGGLKGWWEKPGHWGPADGLSVFSARTAGDRVVEPAVLEVFLRQAVVEALIVQGKVGEEGLMGTSWAAADKDGLMRAVAVDVAVSEAGDVTLSGDLGGVLSGLQASEEGEVGSEASAGEEAAGQEGPGESLTGDEAREMMKSWDRTWRKLPITNPALKFAIHKRVYQLTGARIPDSKLAPLRTPQHLLTVLAGPSTKPRKVLEEMQSPRGRGSELLGLPNVKVYNRRVTPIDKEVWAGRWKVIEEELRKRGLPVTGTGGVGKAREKDWLMGKP